MDASFSSEQSRNLLAASRRLLPSAIVLTTREQVLEAMELGLERSKIFGRVIVNSWTSADNFAVDVTGLEIADLERLQRASDTGAFDEPRGGGGGGGRGGGEGQYGGGQYGG
ncbi:MAG: hypothetical protein FJ038_13130 [Chloroflexi bacterium]|nr:hypothetical protein [Chloroflexota bacterium]